MKNSKLFLHEQEKYNLVHKYHGTSPDQIGYGRQINELLSKESRFHTFWRECLVEGLSFLEIGLGAGEIVRFFHQREQTYLGIDIADQVVNELVNEGLNVKHISCHQMSDIPDNSFDVVQHLDGMEHIPVEWETQTLQEEIRVSKQFVFHANAMGDAFLDTISKQGGFDEVHVNIKNKEKWDLFYDTHQGGFGYKINHREVIGNTYYIILEKK